MALTYRQQGQQALSKATVHPAQDEGDADQEPDDELERPGPPEPPKHLQRSAHGVNEGSQLCLSEVQAEYRFDLPLLKRRGLPEDLHGCIMQELSPTPLSRSQSAIMHSVVGMALAFC